MKELFQWLKLKAYLKHKRKMALLRHAGDHPNSVPALLYYRLT